MPYDQRESATSAAAGWPWATVLITLACIVVYLGLAVTNDYESLDNLSRWGYVDGGAIWNGRYWGLITSCFVHFAFLHLAFNVYWLWVLGGRFELQYGPVAYLLFFAFSGFVSSSFQLALSDTTGIGASGVGYALFGFALLARRSVPRFAEVLDDRMVVLWIAWLLGCIVTTYLEIFPVGNFAHLSGMLFGYLAATYFIQGKKVAIPAVVALVILACVPLFWAPWSVTWLGHKAQRLHAERNYEAAFDYYSRVIELDPNAAWAIWNRGCVYHDLEQYEKSAADLKRAKSIDPDVENFGER